MTSPNLILSRHAFLVLFMFALTLSGAFSMSGNADTTEQVWQAPGPLGALEGVYLTTGDTSSPTVIIVPGSGPTDRDGNNPLGVTAATYRYLAQDLAKAGISSIRIDKRGMFGSKTAVKDANKVTLADYADDIHSWIRVAREKNDGSCVWLLGHSEGALVVLLAAQTKGPVCGLLLVSSPGRTFGDVLRQQLRDNPANTPLLDDAMTAIKALESGRKVDVTKFHPALQGLFAPQVQGYMSDLMAYDPAKLIANIPVPVLILQGEQDLQVTLQDANRLHGALPAARLVLIPRSNHVLKQVTSDNRAANLATYADPSAPLAPGVIDAITNFVKEPSARK
ncbi:MAG: alpha/beta fold hydrolase [Anderseniella sp.]